MTVLHFLCLDKAWNADPSIRRLSYRRIGVKRESSAILRLMTKVDVCQFVHTLVFATTASVIQQEWESVVPLLTELKYLVINKNIPMSEGLLQRVPFRLEVFKALGPVLEPWVQLLASQGDLHHLYFRQDLTFPVPNRRQLPRLTSLKASPQVVAEFLAVHPLEQVWVHQVLTRSWQDLLLDEEGEWSSVVEFFSPNLAFVSAWNARAQAAANRFDLIQIGALLNEQFANLRTLVLIFEQHSKHNDIPLDHLWDLYNPSNRNGHPKQVSILIGGDRGRLPMSQ
ncbi:hypothetical protein FB45DRAFT_870655 [Roridomyces roridus]|uniref:Uncharacterized protein n=1 Tax=Roridomyces roridus TaxID=1738132 RepID=A0AAD7FJJ2_9AGAR|nr:hypothetical protein FB45DRAFT_870655 [Roridomyces roridus]